MTVTFTFNDRKTTYRNVYKFARKPTEWLIFERGKSEPVSVPVTARPVSIHTTR